MCKGLKFHLDGTLLLWHFTETFFNKISDLNLTSWCCLAIFSSSSFFLRTFSLSILASCCTKSSTSKHSFLEFEARKLMITFVSYNSIYYLNCLGSMLISICESYFCYPNDLNSWPQFWNLLWPIFLPGSRWWSGQRCQRTRHSGWSPGPRRIGDRRGQT